MGDKQARSHGKYTDTGSISVPTKQTSMCSSIIWNISKALEKNPNMDLTRALREAHERLEHESRDESEIISQTPERHLTCALLAWRKLGHTAVDGLCKFIEENRIEPVCSTSESLADKNNIENVNKAGVFTKPINKDHKRSENIRDVDSTIFDTCSLMGPVVKLPVETKVVMRFTSPPPCQHHLKKQQKNKNDVKNKIDAACCMDSACIQRLSELDQAVNDLRNRAVQLARREAERVELLERAEAGWKDLELGYQRRLMLAEEKEDDMAKQIKKSIEERNSYKNVCTNLAELLKQRGATAEKERERLKTLEKEVCDRACHRMRLSEESGKGDAALAEELCRVSQMDRDLQFKEEQARRKVKSLESELESTQCVTYEAERAMRFELSALKEQVTEVSKKLLAEEDNNNSIKIELEQYRQEKENIIEDLDGCKDMCDSRMKARMDTLNQKREQLKELKDRVMECQCKLPLDVAVEVKRTPSLAALCRCTPEDKLLESCSCTSLRSQLLSNLLSDLFGGLQAELGTSGLMMPCALLLCLDDRHNWDRASAVKTSLRNFFAQLLVGELDIAIATSIEKYHAKWVGATCADKARLIPDPGEEVTEGWEQRAIERRAQKLASKMAEQLFEERAEELKQKAKDIVTSGPPPCECKGNQPAVYSCLVKAPTSNNAHKSSEVAPSYMRRTMLDVTHLKHQIEDLKKDSIKKEDLRQMEEKIAKIIQRAAKADNSPTTSKNIKCIKHNQELIDLKKKYCDENSKTNGTVKRKEADICNLKKYVKKSSNNQLGRIDKNSNKMFKKLEQSFAVNLCLCSGQEAPTKLSQAIQRNSNFKPLKQPQLLEDLVTDISRHSKPINNLEIKEESNQLSKLSSKTICPSDCICFHKIPSNTSIDKLLETLSKWNGSLNKILEDTKFSCNQTENENKSLNSAVISSENNKKEHDESSIPIDQTVVSNEPNKEGFNKDASYGNALPPTTESEYLGAINLDKSNYNICKCPVNNNTNIMYGDGKLPDNAPFQCINADLCECKSSILNKQFQDPGYYEHVPSKIKKISHAYSVELEKPTFKCTETETDSLNRNNSTKSVGISEDTFIHDVVRKSQLFPNNCDYFVKFLGVTLTNSSSPNKTKQSYDNNTLHAPSKLPNDNENMIQQVFSNIKLNYTKSSLLSGLENCENKKLERESFDHITEKDKIPSEVLDMNKDVCVCCKKKETSKDLELNAFNLLQEHIKKKLEDFLRSSCKSSSLPLEEENKLFSTIWFKVKEVISESTKGLSCKCCEESANEGSWSRAYGMLQEYLKVKIKRVQCSCVSSDGNVESILPAIMEKVCDLIENDFQRLKEKLKCDKDDNENSDKLNTKFCCNENFNRTNNEIATRTDEHILLQRTSCLSLDQSSDVLGSMILSTSEKKVSCEFKIYGTDCNCPQQFSKSTNLGKDYIVSQCTDACNEVKHPIESSLKKISSKESNEENVCFVDCIETKQELKAKIPYIGYTLSCKSLVQNETDKIDNMWRSLTDETCTRKCSYIMHKVVTEEKSENICNMNNPCSSNIRSESCRGNINDTEVSTLDNDENLVLKYSNDKDDIRTFDETSAGTKNTNNDNSSSTHECGLQQFIDNNTYEIDKYNTKFLYDSLHLPTATDYLTKPVKIGTMDIDNRDDLEKDKCDCKMVPICHVKMLVNSIEKKLIESKCTCDSLNSQLCPVHNSYAIGHID